MTEIIKDIIINLGTFVLINLFDSLINLIEQYVKKTNKRFVKISEKAMNDKAVIFLAFGKPPSSIFIFILSTMILPILCTISEPKIHIRNVKVIERNCF